MLMLSGCVLLSVKSGNNSCAVPPCYNLTGLFREITCEECFDGLKKGVEQLLQEETIAAIVEALSGDAFCAQSEDAERCAAAIQTLIPLALPALTANPDEEAGMMVCNGAIPDICS